MGTQRHESRLDVSCRRDGALGCTQLARKGGGSLEEELLPLGDAGCVRFSVYELIVDFCAQCIQLHASVRRGLRSAARVQKGGLAKGGCNGPKV